MAGEGDDRLAQTATAPESNPSTTSVQAIGDTLGRYKLQRELGSGAMGVVHAAFDPDLERRVALKVLRGTDSPEARQRLLREARAMARLTHPNVVTVHEVGSASGRDYVAMELIDGATLDDWLREAPRTEDEILSAFVAAGRGLAAAHAAGLVHRDFKPRNVLRHKDGRIVVTDFGLVVGIETAGDVSLEETLRPAQATSSPSSMFGLTATGSLLGTPAYMAPEQWSSGPIGPQADQFSFCVALWEALAKERPFRGETLDELKAKVLAGPDTLDDSKLPRRLRAPLRRGLAIDPAKRWPSMNALLAHIAPSSKSRTLLFALAGTALVAAGALALLALGGDDEAVAACGGRKDPFAGLVRELPASQAVSATAIAADVRAAGDVRARACKAEPSVRVARLDCLDGVAARIDLAQRALIHLGETRRIGISELLVDPAMCELPRPPRLLRTASPELFDVTAEMLRFQSSRELLDEDAATKLIERSANEPCAASVARELAALARTSSAERNADIDEAERAAQRCGDDRLIASVALAAAQWSLREGVLDVQITTRVKRAETAVEVVPQLDLRADFELLRAALAHQGDNLDEAITRSEAAMKLYEQRGRKTSAIAAGMAASSYRKVRGRPEDLARIVPELIAWRAEAAALLGADDNFVANLDQSLAMAQWSNGDVAGAHAKLRALYKPRPNPKPIQIVGRVVDETGAPVAGATVVAGRSMVGDSVSVAMPNDNHRYATTSADGRFVIDGAVNEGVIIAQHGDKRSGPAEIAKEVTLALAPTSRIEGKVDLRGEPASTVELAVREVTPKNEAPYYGIQAPVQPDGTFSIDGVPRTRVLLQVGVSRATANVVAGQQLVVDKPVISNLALALQLSKRVVHIIVRSTVGLPVTNGQAVIMPGVVPSSNLHDLGEALTSANLKMLRPIIRENAPPAVIAKAKPGDLYATIPEVPDGQVSACAVGLPPNLNDATFGEQISSDENRKRIAIPCVALGPNDDVAIVEVPPWPRFD